MNGAIFESFIFPILLIPLCLEAGIDVEIKMCFPLKSIICTLLTKVLQNKTNKQNLDPSVVNQNDVKYQNEKIRILFQKSRTTLWMGGNEQVLPVGYRA
jgi:hypothetical protein